MALDTLYGVGTYGVEVDDEGYVVIANKPIPPQNFESVQVSRGLNTVAPNLDVAAFKTASAPKSTWYTNTILDMAGVGERKKYQHNAGTSKAKTSKRLEERAEAAPVSKVLKRMKALF
jgi:hypothetical protein